MTKTKLWKNTTKMKKKWQNSVKTQYLISTFDKTCYTYVKVLKKFFFYFSDPSITFEAI